jgi:hypothetical protein
VDPLTEAVGALVLMLVAVAIVLGLVAAIVHEWAWLRRGLAKLRTRPPEPHEVLFQRQREEMGELR